MKKNCGIDNLVFDFEMVYWADLLYKNPQHEDKTFNFDKLYNDEPYKETKNGALKQH